MLNGLAIHLADSVYNRAFSKPIRNNYIGSSVQIANGWKSEDIRDDSISSFMSILLTHAVPDWRTVKIVLINTSVRRS